MAITSIQETSSSGYLIQIGIGAVAITILYCAIRCLVRRNQRAAPEVPLTDRQIAPGRNSPVQRAASRHFQSLTESPQ